MMIDRVVRHTKSQMLSWLFAGFVVYLWVCTLFIENFDCCVFLKICKKQTPKKMESLLKSDVEVILEGFNNGDYFSEMYFPSFMDTEEKYNTVMRRTKDLDSFMKLILELAGDPLVTPSRLLTLTRSIERDLKLVHNKDVFRNFLHVVESVMTFMSSESK